MGVLGSRCSGSSGKGNKSQGKEDQKVLGVVDREANRLFGLENWCQECSRQIQGTDYCRETPYRRLRGLPLYCVGIRSQCHPQKLYTQTYICMYCPGNKSGLKQKILLLRKGPVSLC